MERIAVSVIGGAAAGGAYALIGLGLVLAFRATYTLSFMQGQLMLLAAFIVAKIQASRTVPVDLGVVVAVAVAAVVCVLFYIFVLQRIIGLPHFVGFVATLGLASILDGVMTLIFGSNEYFFHFPGMPKGSLDVFGGRVPTTSVVVAVFTFVVAGIVASAFRFTEWGIRVRAAGQDPVLASQGGINVRRVYTTSWAIAGILAAFAGIALGSTNLIDTSMENLAGAAFPAILLGGLDSIEGAVVGGVIIGVGQGFVATYLGGQFLDVTTYGALLLILLVRPAGLFGTVQASRV
ncbi:MAG TPA: branched-chain amino acid ABC transporter permease [Jatrophihabitantaceae bacterium]|nr:branched-chain amino acid ABC transporter permease [Jatrophihabitantaceae bacterium]